MAGELRKLQAIFHTSHASVLVYIFNKNAFVHMTIFVWFLMGITCSIIWEMRQSSPIKTASVIKTVRLIVISFLIYIWEA